jgi:hypothetical protein
MRSISVSQSSSSLHHDGLTRAPMLVLVRSGDGNPFAAYLAELLRIEGLNWLEVHDLEAAPLRSDEPLPPLVLAAAVACDEHTAAQLAQHVRQGGALLAARPCPALAAALGLAGGQPFWHGRYVLLEPASALVAGLPWGEDGVQYQGAASGYTAYGTELEQVEIAAWLAPFPGQRSRYPALLAGRLGRGRVAVFTYDPAESAVLQQQGCPAQASTGAWPDFDGDGVFRPNDLFLGRLDPARRDVPQADLQRTLLLRAIEWLTEERPLPRLWRFPGNAPAAVLIDGDSDNMSLDDLSLACETCERYGACFATYLKPEHIELLDPAREQALRARGHRFGVHPWAGPQPSPAALAAVLEADCTAFVARYGYRPRIHRGHWLVWPGWVEHARTLAAAGIRLEASFAAGRGFQGGYVNGTGLPVRFVAEDSTLLELFEQSTISTDDGWLSSKTGLPALTLAEAIARSCAQIDDAAERYHTVYHPYFHPVLLRGGRALPYPTLPWLEAVLAHCQRRGLLFLDAEQWLDWNAARRSVCLVALEHPADGRGLSCTLQAAEPVHDLSVLVPVPPGAGHIEVAVDGAPGNMAGTGEEGTVLRHGRRYAAVTLSLRRAECRRIQVQWRNGT